MPGEVVLLDTSAFRSLSKDELAQALSRRLKLTAAPYCFWELLCHLDEGEDFARAKGHLMKFRGVEIVDKPLDRVVAQSEPDPEKRVWSSDLVYAALAAIEEANSLKDLNRSVIKDEAGDQRALKDCVDRVRRLLAKEENRFREFMTKLIGLLQSGDVRTDAPLEKHNAIMSMVASGGTPLPDTADLDYAAGADEDQVVVCSYIYWGYVLHRATQLAQAGGTTCAENDFEDGQVCAYVPLDQPMRVASGDANLLEILTSVGAVLRAVGWGRRACFIAVGPSCLTQGDAS